MPTVAVNGKPTLEAPMVVVTRPGVRLPRIPGWSELSRVTDGVGFTTTRLAPVAALEPLELPPLRRPEREAAA